eukprot:Nitzschia sp. Nitz4//scaffold530_size3649//1391//3416//NITZ4_009262-RA/size3649-augustus-gene-0.2-mRNA-1//-1//CDS//3329554111//2792//frame0
MSNNTNQGMLDAPPPLMSMFINSTDTLRRREINQRIPQEWSDSPPLFHVRVSQRRKFWRGPQEENVTEEEDPNLLKGMIRKGIPPALRCAVWISNVIQAANPHQELKIAHQYRTLAKVQLLDQTYQNLWDSGILRASDVQPVSFGNANIWEKMNDCPGKKSMENVLCALSNVLGHIEYAPLIPSLASILLGFMSESYVFCTIREMANHSTWYWAASKPEHVAYGKAFLDVLGRLHPHTLETMREKGTEERFTQALFQDFLLDTMPETYILRLMDIYTLEGTKALFRFGVAVVVLYQREWKDRYMYELETSWWDGLLKFTRSPTFNFELVIKKAYGVHGKGVRRRHHFPRRPILARIIQLEEERYLREQTTDIEPDLLRIRPLGLVPAKPPPQPDVEPVVPKLAQSLLLRTKLAEWLPLSLRFTNLDLIYSTNHHGRTLECLYRNVARTRRTIMLIEPISTKEEMVVGMFAPQTWHPSPKVYGDGSCFLFRVVPTNPDENNGGTNCWKWHPKELQNLLDDSLDENTTALLEQFQVSTNNYISMGGNPNGTSGLRLNEDLTKGESSSASGFDNDPLAGEMFEIGLVEVYQLVREGDGRAVY